LEVAVTQNRHGEERSHLYAC